MNKDLGNDNIYKLLIKLSIPAILSMVVAAVYNLVDRIFLGRVNPLSLSAVGITMPFQIVQMAFVLLIGVGGSTLLSIRYGENDIEECEKILFTSLVYIFLSEIILTLLGIIFLDEIFVLLGISDKIYHLSKDYITIILLGGSIGLSGYCLNNMVRSLGFSKQSMIFVVVSSILNIILDAIFIFGFKWGVQGAAIATVISEALVTVFVLWFFVFNKKSPIRLRFKLSYFNIKTIMDITSNGLPNFYMQIFGTVMGIVLNRFIIHYGNEYNIASLTIITSIMMFFTMIIYGISQGAQPIIGFNFGAKKIERSKQTLKISIYMIAFVTFASLLLLELCPGLFIAPFIKGDQYLFDITKVNMRLYIIGLPFIGFHSLVTTYFQSLKLPKFSSVLYVLRYGGILIPLLFIIPQFLGINGIFLSNSISDILAGTIALILLKRIKIEDYM